MQKQVTSISGPTAVPTFKS